MHLSRGLRLCLCVAALALGAAAPAQARTIKVTMQGADFFPQKIKAKIGDTIIWINKDIFPHTATVDDGFDVFIDGMGTESLVLDKAGNFEFYCRFHPNMRGMIHIGPKARK